MEAPIRALIVAADNFEDTELLVPYYRLKEEGIEVDIASLSKGKIKGKYGYQVEANLSVEEVNPDNYNLLILPGGKAPATLRNNTHVLDIVRKFVDTQKPVGAICHGPQILISAGVVKGKRLTSYRSVASELKEAGAHYEDIEVVVDGNLITSRQPSDLPAFMRKIMQTLRKL